MKNLINKTLSGDSFIAALEEVRCDMFDGEVVIAIDYTTYYLQLVGRQPMLVDDEPKPCAGRKWRLSLHMTPDEVRQTLFSALLAYFEHELRESFTYKGVAILGPHLSHDALVEMHANGNAISEREPV